MFGVLNGGQLGHGLQGGADGPIEDQVEQMGLVGDVVVEAGPAGAERASHVVQTGRIEAALAEHLNGHVHDLALPGQEGNGRLVLTRPSPPAHLPHAHRRLGKHPEPTSTLPSSGNSSSEWAQ